MSDFRGVAHFGQHWQVHNSDQSVTKVARELEVIEELYADRRLNQLMKQIMDRVPLDYWGLDLGYAGKDANFVLFEGNPAMSMLFNPKVPTEKTHAARVRREKTAIGRLLGEKLAEHLRQQASWRFNGNQVGAVLGEA